VHDKVGCHAAAKIFMTAPGEEEHCHTPTFLIPVILSEARYWLRQCLAQSKDPIARVRQHRLRREFPPYPRQQRKNALTRPRLPAVPWGPSTTLSPASRTPTPLRMTVRYCARQGWMSRSPRPLSQGRQRSEATPVWNGHSCPLPLPLILMLPLMLKLILTLRWAPHFSRLLRESLP
jgi:hypothetical protein